MQNILCLNPDSTEKNINIQLAICLLWKQDEAVVHVGHVFSFPGLEDSGGLPSALSLSKLLEISWSPQKSLEGPWAQAMSSKLADG